RAPARAGRHLVRRAARRLADHARRDRRDGRGRAGGPAGVCPADPTVSRCERGLSGRDLGGSVLSSFPVRDDRSFRAHAPSLLPLQSARLHHGLPSGALPRRGRGALGAALRPAGVVRRGGAAAAPAPRRVVRAAAGPGGEAAPVAPAKRELTFLLADPERRLLRAVAARLPAVVTPDHLTALGVLGALGVGAAYALSRVGAGWLWAG